MVLIKLKLENHDLVAGFDISSSAIGITILKSDGSVFLCTAIDFKNKKKFPTLFSKALFFEDYCNSLPKEIKKITIESPLKMFMPGKSSANTISTLLSFNGIISWILFKHFDIMPEYVSASSARKQYGITTPKGINAKKFVIDYLIKNDLIFLPFVAYTRTGSISPLSYDKSDSYIIAKSALLTS